MKGKRYTSEQIIYALKRVEGGEKASEVSVQTREPSSVIFSTKAMMAFFGTVSFHDGSDSAATNKQLPDTPTAQANEQVHRKSEITCDCEFLIHQSPTLPSL